MEVLHARCAGLDVHKDSVVACARVVAGSRASHETEEFATTTSGLLKLADWLRERHCTHVAMEATGVYWKPVWHVLDGGGFELLLVNPAHARNVPGRKSDVNDAHWLADLLAHGLVRPSFVPPPPIQELRDLTRTRKQLVRQVGRHTLRIEKTLEDANLKLTGVISDLLGTSGRAILKALIAGETDPERLLARTTGRLEAPRGRLLEGLRGVVTDHHRFMLKLHLRQIEALKAAIAQLERRMEKLLRPFRERVEQLDTIPGVDVTVAQVLIAEIGLDMTRFPTAGHLVSWAGLCPRMDESAGKRRSTRVRKGAPWLKTTLVTAGWGAAASRDTYLRAQFVRLKTRRGPQKAVVAVAASILTAAYYILRDHVTYRELGPDYFDRRDRKSVLRRLTRRIAALGYEVELRPVA
ncbi:MAG TPA: IS110 family transposase [Candidatus Eisenbacteria bacterium]|jgi:transposase